MAVPGWPLAIALFACGHETPPPHQPAARAKPSVPSPQDIDDVSPWASPVVPDLDPWPGLTSLSAKDCGTCHPDVFAEWSATTHAHAWTDAQFQAELRKDPEVAWICLNCHTPLQAQQSELVDYHGSVRTAERSANPSFDASLRDEGVTCLTCHYRPEGIAAVHEDVDAPHPTVYAPELRDAETCMQCHEAQARVNPTLVCAFSTGSEWQASGESKTCQGCHMPPIERSHALGAPVRLGGRHLWAGSNIPKDKRSPEEAALFADWQPGTEAKLEVPDTAATGAPMTARLRLKNVRAGHRVPSGDPERHLAVTLTVKSPTGEPISIAEGQIGQRWEWWPEANLLSDNRIKPGDSAEISVEWTQPSTPVSVEARVEHVRITEKNAQYHQLDDYPKRKTVHALTAIVNPNTPSD